MHSIPKLKLPFVISVVSLSSPQFQAKSWEDHIHRSCERGITPLSGWQAGRSPAKNFTGLARKVSALGCKVSPEQQISPE